MFRVFDVFCRCVRLLVFSDGEREIVARTQFDGSCTIFPSVECFFLFRDSLLLVLFSHYLFFQVLSFSTRLFLLSTAPNPSLRSSMHLHPRSWFVAILVYCYFFDTDT